MSRSWVKPPALMVVTACAFLLGMSEYRAGLAGCEQDSAGAATVDRVIASAYTLHNGELSLLPRPRTSLEQRNVLAALQPPGRPLALRDYDDFRREVRLKPLTATTELTYSEVIHAANLGFWSDLPVRFARNDAVFVATDADPITATVSEPAAVLSSVRDEQGRSATAQEMGPPLPDRRFGIDEASPDMVTAFVGPPQPAGLLSMTAPHVDRRVAEKHRLPFDPLRVGPFTDIEARDEQREAERVSIAQASGEFHTVPITYEIVHRIRPNQTVSDVLDEHGITPREADEWITAARKAHNLNRVYAGQKLSLHIHGPTNKIAKLVLEISDGSNLVVERRDGRIVSRREEVETLRNVRVVSGTINSSLYMAAVAKGVPDKVVSDIAEILGWEINFSRDLRPGADFMVSYEELSRAGSDKKSAGRVLSVQIDNRGKRHEGFYYSDETTAIRGYFDRKGDGLGRFFLRYPVSFSRISSQFSNQRFHPVLKRSRPHYGVDFAAPTGTPVKAVADGKVVKAGWHGGNGRFVKISHGSTYETGYAHLSRIAASTKVGAWVKKGQVIGYVGSSGLATGPHLHFALYKNGTYVDPLKANLPRTESLTGAHLMAHKLTIAATEDAYAKALADPKGSVVLASLPKL